MSVSEDIRSTLMRWRSDTTGQTLHPMCKDHIYLVVCLFWLLLEERWYVVSRILIMACHGEIKVELIYFL